MTENLVDEVLIVWELHNIGDSDDGELFVTVDAAKHVASVPWEGEPPIELTWVERPSSEVSGAVAHHGKSPDGYEYMIFPRKVWS